MELGKAVRECPVDLRRLERARSLGRATGHPMFIAMAELD